MLCGITCLQMICKFYGKKYTSEFLTGLCHATTEGVSLLSINETAISLGFHTLCARVDIKTLITSSLPCILHWNQNHFVVLYKVNNSPVTSMLHSK